ncbi:MAG: archaellin/type IV pilin N-terminal domain-containing protein [Thermoplasmataceae archaeon]
MTLQLKRMDKAVSPIIGTVLLVAITVSLVASAFTILHNYVPNPGPIPPSATVEIQNSTGVLNLPVSGNYTMTVSQITENVSMSNVMISIQFQNGSIDSASLAKYTPSQQSFNINGNVKVIVYDQTKYLVPGTVILISLNNSPSFVSRVSLIDTLTDSTMVSVYF